MVYRKRQYRPRRNIRRKRGFGLDVSLGKNVPFLGGSSMRLGTRAVTKIARREIMKNEETKLITCTSTNFPGGTAPAFSTPLLNETLYTWNPLQLISQGDDVFERVGRQIFVRHVDFRIVVERPPTNNVDVNYRMLVLWSEQNYINPNAAFYATSLVTSSDLFHQSSIGTGASLHHAFFDNKKNFKVICERRVTIKASDSTSPSGTEREYNLKCPINQKVTFTSQNVPCLLKDKQLHLVLIPTQTGSASGTTHNARVTVQSLVTYKDA